jgi:hypothetical protein
MWIGDLKSLSMRYIVGPWGKSYCLDIVTNLLGDKLGDVLVEGILDADLIAVCVGTSLADHSWFERCNRD